LKKKLRDKIKIGNGVVATMMRRRFDGRSTAYQRSLRSQWRNPLGAVTMTYLFIYVFRSQCSSPHTCRSTVET